MSFFKKHHWQWLGLYAIVTVICCLVTPASAFTIKKVANYNNEPPTVSDVSKAATENTTIVFQAADFTAKFTDPDSDSLVKIKVTSLPTHGTLKLADTAVEINQEIITADLDNLTFEPEENWLGNTSFSWQGNDGTVYSTNTANVNMAIVEALSLVIVGSLDTDGEAEGVAVVGDYAYVADSSKGLKVVNIATPSTPELVGSLDTNDYAMGVTVVGNYAYVADWSEGLKIINIATPSAPELVGSLDTDGYALKVAVAGDYAYVADDNKGLKIINIADPAAPELIGSLATDGEIVGVAVAGDYAYVADYDEGLKVVNIATPSAPELIGSLVTPGRASGIAVAGDYAYIASREKGLQIVNIATPSAPKLVSSLDTDGYAVGVVIAGDYAYVADYDEGLKIINIASPEAPVLVGRLDTDDKAVGVAVAGIYTYLADEEDGLKVIRNNESPSINNVSKAKTKNTTVTFSSADFTAEYSDPDGDSLVKIKVTSLPSHGTLKLAETEVVVEQEIVTADLANLTFVPEENWVGDTSFAWQGYDGYVYSAATANVNIAIVATLTPVLIGSLNTKGHSNGVAVRAEYAYLADSDEGLQIIDIATPSAPSLVGSLDTDEESLGVAVAGDYAYVADWSAGLKIINIADPSAPNLAGSLDTDGSARGVAVAGDYAYVADYDKGLKIINIADPSSPNLAGSLDTDGSARGVAVAGDYAYVADGSKGLKIINIADPSVPNLAGSLDTDGYAWGVAVAGDYAYVADGSKGLKIINISDPSAPNLAGSLDTDGEAYGVAVAGDYAYVADYSEGLKIINIATPSAPVLVGSLDTDGRAYGVAVVDEYVYIADLSKGLKIIRSDEAPPLVSDIAKAELPNNIITFNATDFTSKFTDPDGDSLTKIQTTSTPNNGTLKLADSVVTINQEIATSSLADLTFDPVVNWHGRTSFTWKGNDGFEYSTAAAKVNLLLDTPPIVSDITKSTAETKTIKFYAQDFIAAFTDADSDSLSQVKITGLPDTGTLELAETAVAVNDTISTNNLDYLAFIPQAQWHGETSFTWQGSDGFLYSTDVAKATVTIANTPPVIDDITKLGSVDQVIEFSKIDFTSEFSDANDDSLAKIKVVSLPKTGGQLKLSDEAIAEDQEITRGKLTDIIFTPQAGWYGKTSFAWQGSDGTSYSNEATVFLDIAAQDFCVKYWWLCYLIPACVTATGITASIGLAIFGYYKKWKKPSLVGGNEIELTTNPVFAAPV